MINNQTQGRTFVYPGAFESGVKLDEIFVFCTSRTLSGELAEEFQAVVCVEILDIAAFCARVAAVLPPNATFPGRPGKTRIGQRVDYYRPTDSCSPRWALPDRIAMSKLETYARQAEFRLVFSLTAALAFENVRLRLVPDAAQDVPDVIEHREFRATTRSLRDICRLTEA